MNQARRGQSRALTFTESPEEEAALVKLQAVLSQELPDASSTAWYPEVHGEVRLLRFLRKAKGRVDVAACRYREMLQWRRDADVDAVRSRGRSRGRSLARSLNLSVSNPEPSLSRCAMIWCSSRGAPPGCAPPTSATSARCSE